MRTMRIAVAAACLALAAGFAGAGDEAAAKALEALEARFETTDLPWTKSYEAFLPEYEALAKKYAGTEQALTARLRVLQFAGRFKQDEARMKQEAGKLVDGILADFPKSPQLGELPDLWYLFEKEKFQEVMKALSDPTQPDAVKAAVLLHRAKSLRGGNRGAEAKPLFEEILAKYKDLPKGYSTYGALADALANPHAPADLVVGKPAPEIVGKDVDGKEIRLSDYRGKVVVIDFFGDW